TVPPLDTCAVRPRPTRALDTLPRNSAERDALSAAACERAPASPKCSVVSAVSRWASSATYHSSTPPPAHLPRATSLLVSRGWSGGAESAAALPVSPKAVALVAG